MRKLSLRAQILLLVVALVMTSVASLAILTLVQMEYQLHDSLDHKAESICAMVVANVTPGIEFQDSAYVADYVANAFADNDVVGVCVCGADEVKIVVDIRTEMPPQVFELCETVDSTSRHVDGSMTVVFMPVMSQGERIGDIWVALSEEAVHAQIRNLAYYTAGTAVVLLAIIIVVGLIIARRIVQPITLFEEASERIKAGDMTTGIKVSELHRDFVGLGSSFNNMQNSLNVAFEQLNESRNHLEAQVSERTSALRRELSDRKQAEQIAQMRGEQLRATLESTADGILVVNSEGTVTHANARFAELWRIPKDIMESRDDERLLGFVVSQLADPDAFVGKIQELYQSNAESFDTLEFEDGRVFDRYSCPLIQGEQVTGRVWSFRDVTDQRKAEVELRRSRQKLLLHVQQTPLGVIEWDLDFHVVEWNRAAARIFGYTRKEAIGHHPTGLILPNNEEVRKAVDQVWQGLLSRRGGTRNTNANITKDGRSLVCEWYNTPLIDDEGNVIGAASLVQDVTEAKLAEEQKKELTERLERAERMESLGILAGGVAHDLNNMLGPVVGYSELILAQLDSEDRMAKRVQKISKSAQDAADVIQDLLTLARRGRYEMVPTSMNQIINDYIDSPSFAKMSEDHTEVTLELDLDPKVGNIMGSSPHLSKVVMNLVVNAYDAMPEGGQLKIRTARQFVDRLMGGHEGVVPKDYVILSVHDCGMGIDPKDLSKIFEPYYSKKKMGSSGSGLGLSVVYGVVKDHRGYYDILSTVGEGTEFILYFPTTETKVEEAESVDDTLHGTETILIVDDVAEQREMAEELLSSFGFKVQSVSNGRQAVDHLREHAVDLVVLDMIMENNFDGLDTYKEIIKIRPSQKALIVSGFSSTDRVEEMQQLGAGPYVRKPYTRETIGRAVRQELDRELQAKPAVT